MFTTNKYYAKNQVRILEQKAEYYIENKEQIAEYKKEYEAKNKEKILAGYKAYYRTENGFAKRLKYRTENDEYVRGLRRAWTKKNPLKAKAYGANRRARDYAAPGTYTDKDVRALYVAQEGRCVYCDKEFGDKFHVDHIIPLTREGTSNWPSNLQLLCPFCNQSKHNKTHEEYLEYLAKKAQVVA